MISLRNEHSALSTGKLTHFPVDKNVYVYFKSNEDELILNIVNSNESEIEFAEVAIYDSIALDNIEFSIEQGSFFGLLGPNGAGKSTLLKLISRITHPTAGRIHIKGRVASLLEVGTGFHPELTGRENTYLNEEEPIPPKSVTDLKPHSLADLLFEPLYSWEKKN